MLFNRFFFLFIAATGLCLSGCSHFLYYPSRRLYITPSHLSFIPVEIVYTSSDGKPFVIWYFDSKSKRIDRPMILFFHGNAENMSSHYSSAYWLLEKGYDFAIFDYPGYGPSPGSPNPENTVRSGVSFLEWAIKMFPNRKFVVWGQSLGGAIALRSVIELSSLKPKSEVILGIVAESTFSSYRSVGADILSRSFWTWLLQPLSYVVLSDKFAPRGRISEISPIPLLVVHGKRDPMIDLNEGEMIFEEAKEPKYLLTVEDGHHTDAFVGKSREENRNLFTQLLENKFSFSSITTSEQPF